MDDPQLNDLKTKLHEALDEMFLAQEQLTKARAFVQALTMVLRNQGLAGYLRPATPGGSASALNHVLPAEPAPGHRDEHATTLNLYDTAAANRDENFLLFETARTEFTVLLGDYAAALSDQEFDLIHQNFAEIEDLLDAYNSLATESNSITTSMESETGWQGESR